MHMKPTSSSKPCKNGWDGPLCSIDLHSQIFGQNPGNVLQNSPSSDMSKSLHLSTAQNWQKVLDVDFSWSQKLLAWRKNLILKLDEGLADVMCSYQRFSQSD
jgi:hypothetical protein